VGLIEQREEDPADGRDAIGLMLAAAQAAGADTGRPAILGQVDLVAVPRGQWRYRDPGRYLGGALGSPAARSVLAVVGVLQQSLIGDACRRIAEGTVDVALVVGGEARYRRLREKITGSRLPATVVDGEPDEVLEPAAELVLESEIASGLGGMPVGYYAIIESAVRAARGLGVHEHRQQIAALYSRFSEVAAQNPHAWRRERLEPDVISGPSPKNPMLAFPYTKLHNSSWNVDQAGALLFCSAQRAASLGISRTRWVFPLASTESNHMTAVSERANLARCPGARIAAHRAFEASGITADQLTFVELYTCFPAAVEVHASEAGIPGGVDWTVTGGMPFAGGPFNNYVLQSTGRMSELLRGRPGSTGLVTSVSGVLTKHGFGVWSTDPGPLPFAWIDVTDEVSASSERRPVLDGYSGRGVVTGYTVVYPDRERRRGVALLDVPAGRFMARTDEPAVLNRMEQEELCGRTVQVTDGIFDLP
jgi:acetyl-CoA C-acetyltransferase